MPIQLTKRPADMTQQEIFDHVSTHLFTQGGRALADDGRSCAYRGEGGTSCAIGCLITDDRYVPHMEGKTAYGLIENITGMRAYLGWHEPLYRDLQNTHDDVRKGFWDTTGNMRAELHRIAEQHALDASILDTLSFADR
jgi:hypothetical protein